MELEKRTMGSMGTSMTTEGALSSVREVGKESSPGCAASSSGTNAEPEGFKRVSLTPLSSSSYHAGQGAVEVSKAPGRVSGEAQAVYPILYISQALPH